MPNNRPGYDLIPIIFYSNKGNEVVKYTKVKSDGCTFFFNSQHLMWELNNKERCFYFYLCEKMNIKKNTVYLDADIKEGFIAFAKNFSNNSVEISLSNINKYISKLKQLGFIFLMPESRSTYYMVNPKYASKDNKTGRIKLLKETIQKRKDSGLSISMLISEDETEFLKPL
jgi:hypothetical protein